MIHHFYTISVLVYLALNASTEWWRGWFTVASVVCVIDAVLTLRANVKRQRMKRAESILLAKTMMEMRQADENRAAAKTVRPGPA